MRHQGAIGFALSRLLGAVPTLLFVVLLAFLMMHAAPGGPFDDERMLPVETRANLEAAYDLDAPLPEQFLSYLGSAVRGDLGPSYYYPGYSVNELIGGALPLSFRLAIFAFSLSLAVGIGAGVIAAVYRNSFLDRLITGLAMTGISIPVLIIAPLMILTFAVHLRWLPASWEGSEDWRRYVLPVIALALPQIAYVARLVRGSMIEVLTSDFIRTARGQGLPTATIVARHAMKPAMLPLLSYVAPAFVAVLAGSVVVEEIFGIPGLGQLFVNAALNRDYTLVLGVVILYASLVIFLNLLVDVLYGFLDPRIRQR